MGTVTYKFYTVWMNDGQKYWFTARSMKHAATMIAVPFSKVERGCDIIKDKPLPGEMRSFKVEEK